MIIKYTVPGIRSLASEVLMGAQRSLACLVFALGACGAMHDVGGKRADEVFLDGAVASLATAACENDTLTVKSLVDDGVDVNSVGFEGTTPLVWALTCNSEEGMLALLESGADPNQYLQDAMNAVFLASTYDNPKLLQTLLDNGGDPNSTDKRIDQPVLEIAFAKGIEDDDWRNFDALLEAGADPGRINRMGGTSVEHFARLNRFDIVNRMLLERGYRHNLDRIRYYCESSLVSDESPLSAERDKCLKILSEI